DELHRPVRVAVELVDDPEVRVRGVGLERRGGEGEGREQATDESHGAAPSREDPGPASVASIGRNGWSAEVHVMEGLAGESGGVWRSVTGLEGRQGMSSRRCSMKGTAARSARRSAE